MASVQGFSGHCILYTAEYASSIGDAGCDVRREVNIMSRKARPLIEPRWRRWEQECSYAPQVCIGLGIVVFLICALFLDQLPFGGVVCGIFWLVGGVAHWLNNRD